MTRGDYVSRGARYWEEWRLMWGVGDVYANYRPGAVGHDFRLNILMDYSRIGQREGEVAFNLLGAGFAGSGWESQSIYALYNVTAVSTTYILAWCQNHSIPVYSINQTNLYEVLPRLHYPGWLREWIKGDVLAGNIVITPDRYVTIERWHGTGWAVINPETGLGAYYILGGLFESTEEIKALEESLGPGDVAVGGAAAIVILMWLYSLLFEGGGGLLSDWLERSNITKDDAAAKAAWSWSSIAVGIGFSLYLLPFLTVNAMLLTIPLGIMFGGGLLVGILVGLTPFTTFSYFILGLSIVFALYYTILAIEPHGEVYVLG
jgi:hypothetical protein